MAESGEPDTGRVQVQPLHVLAAGTVQYSTAQYRVQYNTVQYSTVQLLHVLAAGFLEDGRHRD